MTENQNWYDPIVDGVKNALDAIYAKKTDLTSKADKTNGANQITDTTSTFSHLGTLSDYKQSTINQAIDTKFGTLDTVDIVVTYTDSSTENLTLFKQV